MGRTSGILEEILKRHMQTVRVALYRVSILFLFFDFESKHDIEKL